MGQVLRTTVRLDERLLERAKQEAVRRGETVTALIEEGLQLVLAPANQPPARTKRIKLPVSRGGSGLQPGVDLDDSSALLDLMEDR